MSWKAMHEQIRHHYADYQAALDVEDKLPHCDSLVLHRPGDCKFCDAHPGLQAFRQSHHIAFTGQQPKEHERPCPATWLRPPEVIDRWPGNRPHKEALPELGTRQISLRFDFGEAPSLRGINQLFEDLYARYQASPDYLFVSTADHAAFLRQIYEGRNTCYRGFSPELSFGAVIINEITGKIVHVVALPGLECGSVIVGFFLT